MKEPAKPKRPGAFSEGSLGGPLRALAGLVIILVVFTNLLFPALDKSARKKRMEAVVYCAQDQVFAEPLFKEFTDQTGIRVLPSFDSEAIKTVGMANRLLAERTRPRCDLFWSNEELRTRQLAEHDIFRRTNGWVAAGYRSRRVVINTNLVSSADAPRSLSELTNAAWRGRVVLAYPLFGTTSAHFLALRQQWGDAAWQAWCRALVANKAILVDGNSVAVKFVGRGQAAVGLTDSDDIAAGQREGFPIAALPLTGEMLLIPNTIAVIRAAPHRESAQTLFEHLQQPATLKKLVASGALEGVSMDEVSAPTLKPDWDALLRDLDSSTETLKEIFLR
jgi:iron(III) transport system substrate-binding protein